MPGRARLPRRRSSRVLALLACLLWAPALAACESTQQESAKIERYDKAHAPSLHSSSLSITKPSSVVKVLGTALLSGEEAYAATVTMRNDSPHALSDVPIEITVHGSNGQVLYTNKAPGITGSLVSVPLLLPGEEFTWVDDQVQLGVGGSAKGATVAALLGEVPPVAKPAASLPQMRISDVHSVEEAALGEATAGTVSNPSPVTQEALVVYGVAERGGKVVAAGRAVLSQVGAHGSAPFQIFMIGSSGGGAKVELSAPASTLE